MSDVNRYVQTDETSASNNGKILKSKDLNQWYSINRYDCNADVVIDVVRSGCPIYMSGESDTGSAHAWICDGYKGASGYTILALATLKKTSSSRYYEYQDIDRREDTYPGYYHMNWGAGPEYSANTGDKYAGMNGWYLTISGNASAYEYNVDKDFKNKKKVLTFVPRK